MKKKLIILLTLMVIIGTDGKKLSRSRSSSSGRGASRKTNSNPSPTSLSQPAPNPSAPKPSLFGWQEKPAQRKQTPHKDTHSYPSSQTGLSGNNAAKNPGTQLENVQKSNVPQNFANHQSPSQTGAQPSMNNQQNHAYPASGGLSGSSGSSGGGYPQGGGLSGSGVAAPPSHSASSGLSGGSGSSGVSYPQSGGLSGSGVAAPPPYSAGNYHGNNFGNNYRNPQGPPPPYSANSGVGYPKQQGAPPSYNSGSYPTNNFGSNYHSPQGGHNYGGYQGSRSYNPSYTPQMPGYFGNSFGGVSRTSNALKGVGYAGVGIGTVLTGLALWNLARSTGHHRHTVIYDNRGQPVAVAPGNDTAPVVDPILGDLVNCSLTISSDTGTEVLAIPCAIATSFSPEADVKDKETNIDKNDNTKCTIAVINKAGKEFTTTIPCSILLKSAAENNVTEPTLTNNGTDLVNVTTVASGDAITSSTDQPSALKLFGASTPTQNLSLNCTPEPGDIRDPINPCFAVTHNLTVIPLETSENRLLSTPSSA